MEPDVKQETNIGPQPAEQVFGDIPFHRHTGGDSPQVSYNDLLDAPTSSAAPVNATYITQTSNGTLTNEQALSSLATGIMKVTTGTGVVSSVAAPTTEIVGIGDVQTLTNKSIAASEINSGVLSTDRLGSGSADAQKYLAGDSTWRVLLQLTWNVISGTTQTAVINNGYIANNASLVTITIPAAAAVGDRVVIAGNKGGGGWKLAQSAGQQINFNNQGTSVGTPGYLQSTGQMDVVEILCITANTDWIVLSSQGNITIV